MVQPAYKITDDYEGFDNYILKLIVSNPEKALWHSNIDLEKRLNNLEKGQEQLMLIYKTLDENLKLYREDSKLFMIETKHDNEKFRLEMKTEFVAFKNEIKEDNEKFYLEIKSEFIAFKNETKEDNEKFHLEIKSELSKSKKETDKKFKVIDERFDKIDERFDKIDKRLDKIDERLDKIDNRFEEINKQFIDIHKAINRMTVFFVSGLGIIVLLSKLLDKML
jgi:hypothetical protein